MGIYQRIAKRIRMTRDAYRTDSLFSRRLARYRFVDDIGYRLHFYKAADRAHQKKDAYILSWLKEELAPVFDAYRGENAEMGGQCGTAPIWVCWWSGFDSAPDLVRQCVRSIYQNAGAHPVHFISEETCAEYLEVPDTIAEKVKNGSMGLANFSDYLRFSLLAEYGGLWLDATVFLSEEIPEAYFQMPVFTCRSAYAPRSCYISKMQWTSFIFGGQKGNIFFRCMKTLYEAYWKKADAAIDYLLIDYLIFLVKEEVPQAGRDLEEIPVNNPRRDDLQAAMNAALPAEEFPDIVRPDTVFYKLSWRETYSEYTPDGTESVYGYFLRMDLGGRPA